MAEPLAVYADDLELYLGTTFTSDETERAQLLIDLSMSLVATVVDPIPESAKAIVLTSAGRAYSNPQGVTSEMMGPFQASRPSAGVYLTRSERAALRLASGKGGAFSIDTLVGYPDSRFD